MEIVRSGSFDIAARKLHVTQSAIRVGDDSGTYGIITYGKRRISTVSGWRSC
ncbi:hypothetical protein [Pectobacterium aroidearum]|uniref:hypothetical protein n=1 Tax=Pectobacterium aroidearum TaxID=1201031 RepID=UPI003314FB0E